MKKNLIMFVSAILATVIANFVAITDMFRRDVRPDMVDVAILITVLTILFAMLFKEEEKNK